MARERGLAIDREGFEREMERQRDRARGQLEGRPAGADRSGVSGLGRKAPHPLRRLRSAGIAACRVVALILDQQIVEEIPAGAKGEVILDETPFYAEAGGQVGDTGSLYSLETGRLVAQVEAAYPAVAGLTAHRVVAHRGAADRRQAARGSRRRLAMVHACATTPPRTCSTPRCGGAGRITSNRPAASSSRPACASTSPTTPAWTRPSWKKSSGW